MQIDLIPDASVGSAPAGFTAAIQSAAEVFEQDIPGDYTVNITYGWGTYDNEADDELTAQSGAFSLGGTAPSILVSYATVKSWLSKNAVLSDQISALASLPASYTDLPGDADDFYVSTAQEKALGVYQGNSGAVDGSIGFNTADVNSSAADFEIAALTEIGHALGNLSSDGADIMDLYRYSAPGEYQWTPGRPAYFSIDGGSTDLANYATSFDTTLFENAGASENDPFAYPFTSSTSASLTSLDLEVLNVLGFGGATTTPAVPVDFNDDGKSDILWMNSTTGEVDIWLMNGTSIEPGSGFLADYANWRIQGTGDFNGDGTSDVIWRNTSTGEIDVWLMNGTDVLTGSGEVGSLSTDWQVAGTGDFNGDGKSDILWRNASTGEVDIWFMQGTTIEPGSGYLAEYANWQIQGAGDFNGDGKSDILWRNTSTGEIDIWLMNGSAVLPGSGAVASLAAAWQVAGIGDFNGDGRNDILWRNSSTGELDIWFMNGTTIEAGSGYVADLSTAWTVGGVGDYNGDGKSGILLENTSTGEADIWNMNGTSIGAGSGYLTTLPTAWKPS